MKALKLLVPMLFLVGICSFSLTAQEEEKKQGDVFSIVDEMPVYPGGDNALRQFIAQNVKYPDEAKKNKIQGKVYVSFIVDENGEVTDAKIERGVDPDLDKEALRVIKLQKKWTPGKEKGKTVKVKFTVPIEFKLS